MIDHQSLLLEYMSLIIECEGIDYLNHTYEIERLGIEEESLKELNRLSEQIAHHRKRMNERATSNKQTLT